jgi:predicted NAD/FAD-binding protein
VLFVNRAALFEIPAWIVGAGFARFFSFFSPMTCFRIRGGAQVYLRALAAACKATIRFDTAVASIVRDEARVVVRDARGNAEAFDHVIVSADAGTALRLLDRPSDQERAVLGAARFETTHIQVHTDASVRSGDGAAWAFFNYRDLGADGAGQCTVDVFGQPDGPFVTWDAPRGAIDPAKCVSELALDHIVYSTRWAQILAEQVPAIQGVQRTWFCGGHSVGFPSHEGALVSGLAVACALGASYPFAADRRAVAAFHQVRRQYQAGGRRDVA